MKLLREGRPALLHGAKVGVATSLVAGLYERIQQLTRPEVVDLLEASHLPDRAQQIEQIRLADGELADEIIKEQAPFLNLNEAAYADLKTKILTQWPQIQAIAAQVPDAQTFTTLLQQVHGPHHRSSIGSNRRRTNARGRECALFTQPIYGPQVNVVSGL